jgi:hypothetical protein
MSASTIDRFLSAEIVVQKQLDAYNARDVERFSDLFGEHVKIFRPPVIEPSMVGRDAIKRFYMGQRFNLAKLHAELLHRIVLGDVIIDHRRISGVAENPFEVVAVYEVHSGQIQSVWYFSVK